MSGKNEGILRATLRSGVSLRASVRYADRVGGGGITEIPLMTETTVGGAKLGENLKISETGHLSVETADDFEGDNTRPITAAAVESTVGNIEILLKTI